LRSHNFQESGRAYEASLLRSPKNLEAIHAGGGAAGSLLQSRKSSIVSLFQSHKKLETIHAGGAAGFGVRSRMQEIEDENSTIGESQRLHALNDDDDLCFGVQSLLKSSTSMDAVISLPSVVTDIAAFTANSLKELQVGHYFSP